MKIVKLSALNINSLKGKIEIDFTTFLDNNALFAITGPTGAGKSTILDIITCALYGRTPRLKNPNQLMARHTGECYCEVEFEIRGKVYRSSWTQKRARKSGTGKFQTAKMELSSVSEQKVLKSTLRDVPKYVEELSGLDFDRFVQSMMLAQGSFDAFLKAKESERSSLLEKITGTQIYAKISKNIYDTYIEKKSQIDIETKLLENSSLLEKTQREEKIKDLEQNQKAKEVLDKQLKEILNLKIWLEKLSTLQKDLDKYQELFDTYQKEKEDKKEDFKKLELATKALNVQALYEKKRELEKKIQKDESITNELLCDIENLQIELKTTQVEYETVKQESIKEKQAFEFNNTKIKKIRNLQTQITENDKNLMKIKETIAFKIGLKNNYQKKLDLNQVKYENLQTQIKSIKEYLFRYQKDEKLIESLPLLQKYIQEYEKQKNRLSELRVEKEVLEKQKDIRIFSHQTLNDEVETLFSISELKNKEYKTLEDKSFKDNENEPHYREKLTIFNTLLKEYQLYVELQDKIREEKQEKCSNEKENNFLKESFSSKKTILDELKTHINTLKQKKERELLIVKYEQDREKIKEGEECFLCGSTFHPYIKNDNIINIDVTNDTLKRKEVLYIQNEEQLHIINEKQIKLGEKLKTNQLELIKLNELLETQKEIFKKESLILDDETLLTIETEIANLESLLDTIIQRREERGKLLKEKEDSLKKYTQKQSLFLESQKELEKVRVYGEQKNQEESDILNQLSILTSEIDLELQKFDITFNKDTYKIDVETLALRNTTFRNHLKSLKELELTKNSYDLDNKENETKVIALTSELVSLEESIVELESTISTLKEESVEILNVANIDIFESQIKNSFEKIQKLENNLSQTVNSLVTKIKENEKQQINVAKELLTNKQILVEVTNKFQQELFNNNFNDIEVFENALLPNEIREELSKVCKAIEEQYNKYKTLKIDTQLKLTQHKQKKQTLKGLDLITKELEQLQLKNDEIQKNIGAVAEILKKDNENRAKHQEKIEELEKKKKSFKVWIKLNEMIGSADGAKFAKFAQGITLDQLISLANNHLNLLSNRYELQRSQEQKQLLEIEVCDSFQGDVVRPVSTLSGGESFIVSLSLALGLSELASQQISIDSLFLDEGFGTLDEESLETALNALNLLQSSGKMVGVISHVEALKERIPLQIKITPKGDGTSYISLKGIIK